MKSSRKLSLAYWLRLFVTLVISTYLGIILASAIIMALAVTVPLKGQVCCLDIPHENFTFQTADGLTLAGWYVPPQNGATIILIHAYYGDRRQTLPVAQMLYKHGYGLLMYDQRASGESEGTVRSLGKRDIPDVSQAVIWLQTRPVGGKVPVEGKVGVYGCSMGGAIGLAAAAENPSIAAVVADAPSPLGVGEALPKVGSPGWAVNLPIYILYHGFVSLSAWSLSPTTTTDAVLKIAPRPILFISTGENGEFDYVQTYYNLAGKRKTHWNIPNSGHCAGPGTHPAEYGQHLADFFDSALLDK